MQAVKTYRQPNEREKGVKQSTDASKQRKVKLSDACKHTLTDWVKQSRPHT